jgi:branched-chain amino acid transport system substrate-binding protein
MMVRTLAARSAATAVLVALALASAGAATEGVTDNEILLGTHLDLSGPVAASMPQIRNGMQMRIDEVNEAGGINGRKIRLIVEDNGSQPQMAVRAVQKLTSSDHVFAIVNPFGSGTNAAVVKRATDAGVIYFSPWAAAKPLHAISGSPLLFTTTENYDVTTATGLAWMLDKYKAKRVGVIYQEGPFGDLARAGVTSVLAAHNLKPVAEASYTVGDIDFSSQVARMRAADAEIIVVAALIRETVGVMSEVKKLGWSSVKVMAAQPSTNEDTTNLGKAVVDGLYGVATFNVYYPSDAPGSVKTWMASYRKRFNNLEPSDTAYLSYGFTDWFIKNGLAASGKDLTTDKVVKALTSTSYSSPLFYDAKRFNDGYLAPETVQVEQIQNGEWKKISAVIPPVAVK